jgi:hypothetical protein
MRKTLLLTLVLCVIAAVAYAQAPAASSSGTSTTTSTTTAATGTTGATTTTTTTKPAKHHKAAATKRYKGEVASVDATAKSFVVHPKKGADVTLKVNDKTKYAKGQTWDDVKAGASASGSYKNDGTDNWATSVKVAAAPAAAKTGK